MLNRDGTKWQFGGIPRLGSADGLFTLKTLLNMQKSHNLQTHVCFVDLVKALTGIPLLGFEWEQKTPTFNPITSIPQTSTHHGGAVCPSYSVVSMDTPDRMQVTYSKGVGRERLGGV